LAAPSFPPRRSPDLLFLKRVVVQNQGIVRARPLIHDWSCEIEFEYDTEYMDPAFMALIMNRAGKFPGIGDYRLLGDTQDDAAGEAFDKTAKLLGLPYPGGPALSKLAERGRRGVFALPRPMKDSGDLNMSFSGLKTAVRTLVGEAPPHEQRDADIAREFEDAITDVLVAKSLAALDAAGLSRLVVAGGVGANRSLRERLRLAMADRGGEVFYPDLQFCTDNGAMIALVGALRLEHSQAPDHAFGVQPRWDLASLARPAARSG
jgi:N6-L-threonylcarbamoyladenine synthase